MVISAIALNDCSSHPHSAHEQAGAALADDVDELGQLPVGVVLRDS
jgi:hypothetical protein